MKEKEIGKVHVSQKDIKKIQERIKRVETLTKTISKTFEREGWVQNEYWEEDNNVVCASFINIELDQLSVFIDND